MIRHVVLILALVVGSLAGSRAADAQAVASEPDPARFKADIAAFEELDRRNTPPRNAVLFAGSSSIRLWPTADRFPGWTVINRGFGGSHIADVNHYFSQTAGKYAPAVIVFYAGDNDLGSGKSPARVLADYRVFIDRVHGVRADTDVVFIAVKPSLARWKLWDTVKAFNAEVRAFSASRPRLHFVDVASPMLGPDGRPRAELLVEDGLHMTTAGYDIWTDLVSRAVTPLLKTSRP